MKIEGCQVMLDSCAKFFQSLFLHGWFDACGDGLVAAEFQDDAVPVLHQVSAVGEFHGGVASLGSDKGFHVQVLRAADAEIGAARLVLKTRRGRKIVIPVQQLVDERIRGFATPELYRKFVADLQASRRKLKILDIGGRNRSGLDRSKAFGWADVTVLDIVPGDNVDVVGDAHELSRYFAPESFDAVYCVYVFEHLLMPWKAALEINRVLRPGGRCLVHTHQTLGMHDLPWDFWRFSDSSWDALFNERTGFRIVTRAMDSEQYVIPFLLRQEKMTAEKSAGFEGSTVLAEKVGGTRLEWPVTIAETVGTAYPTHDDGQAGRSYVQ